MRSVLVILEDSPALEAVLACATLVARRFASRVEGLRIQPTLSGLAAAGADSGLVVAPALEETFLAEQRATTDRLCAAFEAAMRAAGIPHTPPGDGPAAQVRIIEAAGNEVFSSRARVFDLTVLGRPTRGAAAPSATTLEALLFDSGRPLLIAPPQAPPTLGERIVIAWNGSPETARSVTFALPFLRQAKAVTVLSVVGGTLHGPGAAEAAAHLAAHGIAAQVVEVSAGARSVGEAILAEAGALGADLLVKGAYTTGRLRQLIFGGATSHIMFAAELPVLMAH